MTAALDMEAEPQAISAGLAAYMAARALRAAEKHLLTALLLLPQKSAAALKRLARGGALADFQRALAFERAKKRYVQSILPLLGNGG